MHIWKYTHIRYSQYLNCTKHKVFHYWFFNVCCFVWFVSVYKRNYSWCNSYFIICVQFAIFNPLSYCFKEIIGFDVKASFSSHPVSRLTRWYNKPGDITSELLEKTIQFHGTFHGLKIINCVVIFIFEQLIKVWGKGEKYG